MSDLKIKELISGPFRSGRTTLLYKRFKEVSKSKSCIFVTPKEFCEFFEHATLLNLQKRMRLMVELYF